VIEITNIMKKTKKERKEKFVMILYKRF